MKKKQSEKYKYCGVREICLDTVGHGVLRVPSWVDESSEKPLENKGKSSATSRSAAATTDPYLPGHSPGTDPVCLDTDPDSPEFFPRFPDESDADNEFFWSQLSDEDREYLTSPRNYPPACAWCGGRTRHSPPCDELRLSWQPKMPVGKHRGKPLSDVPLSYLQWLRCSSIDSELKESVLLEIERREP